MITIEEVLAAAAEANNMIQINGFNKGHFVWEFEPQVKAVIEEHAKTMQCKPCDPNRRPTFYGIPVRWVAEGEGEKPITLKQVNRQKWQ